MVLATALLTLTVILGVFGLLTAWMTVGFARAASTRTLWLPPLILTLWVVVIVMTWRRSAWARILVLVGIGLTGISLLTIVTAAGVGGLLRAPLVWVGLGLRLYAAYLLYRPDSDRWFGRGPLQ